VSKIICRELEAAWRVLHLTFVFEQRQRLGAGSKKLLPPEEKDAGSQLRDPRARRARGTLTIAFFPAVVSNALLRKFSQ